MTSVPYLFDAKQPSDRRSFGFDFSAQPEFVRSITNPTPQTIVSYTVTCGNNDSALTIESPVLSGNRNNPAIVSAYINGGTDGFVYEIKFQVTTNQNTNITRTVLLPVDSSV